ncbi:MAG TPA: hypothetical protein VH253_04665 [Phycisphaerae bacterium]|nr:hypothetical protein [Phycisphaerae bacterium]
MQYNVRDGQGNVYGPATVEMLRQWVREGRIAAGMAIAPEGSETWVDVSAHPGLSDLFAGTAGAGAASTAPVTPVSATPAGASTGGAVSTGAAPHTPVVRAGDAVTPYATPAYTGASGAKMNTLALLSFIAGLLSVLGIPLACCCYGEILTGPLAVAALIMGYLGRNQINANPEGYSSGWMATAGLVLGIVGLAAALLAVALSIVGLIIGHSITPTPSGSGF